MVSQYYNFFFPIFKFCEFLFSFYLFSLFKKSSYEINLHKMTSHFELLTRKVLKKFFFWVTNFDFRKH